MEKTNSEIPIEFLPDMSARHAMDNDSDVLERLFVEVEDRYQGNAVAGDNDDDDSNISCATVIANDGRKFSFRLVLPPDVETLFAHQVWSGSRLMAQFLATNASVLCHNRTVIELGAGTALPSLVALSPELGRCRYCIITDYPNNDVLQCLRETVGQNWVLCGCPINQVTVLGYLWGSSIHEILGAVKKLTCDIADRSMAAAFRSTEWTDDNRDSNNNKGEEAVRDYFDLAILSECLWMHRSHVDLRNSIDQLLHPTRGVAVLTYAHHIPGMEDADDAFFGLCSECDLVEVHTEEHNMEYMWDAAKQITVYLKVLRRKDCSSSTLEFRKVTLT